MKVTIVDYNSGNISSVINSFKEVAKDKVNTERDHNPTLNQAELFLYETKQVGVLRVEIDTETPYFDTFLVKISDREWKEYKKFTFDWSLSEGLNHLRVKVRNQAGVCGKESHITIMANK